MKPASTSMRSSPSMRRTRAGSRMPFSRTRAPSSICGRRLSSPCRASSLVESTVVSNSSRSSRFTFETLRCAWSPAFLRSAVCAIRSMRLLRLRFELRQHLLACAAPVPSAWPIRASPTRAPALSRAPPVPPAAAAKCRRSADGLFQPAVQFAQEPRDVALASLIDCARALHDRPPASPAAPRYRGPPICPAPDVQPDRSARASPRRSPSRR